jgi:polysaccharide biosynthesis protein VpsM
MQHQFHPAARKPREYLSILFVVASLGIATSSHAIMATGPDDELFVTGVASAEANDNVFLSHTNAKSDGIFDLVPGLEFDFGKNSLTKGLLSIDEDFQLYGSESNLDTELTNAVFTSAYDNDKSKLNFDATFHQADQATRDVRLVGVLVKRDLYHLDGLGEVGITDKTSMGLGVIYDDTDYLSSSFTNWQWVKIPFKYYYAVEPKLDVSAGFSYQNNQLGTGGINSDEYFYNLGARGEFTPKLTGGINVGYEQIQFVRGGSRGGLGVDSNFTYAYSPKTNLTFSVNNDFGYSAVGGASYRIFGLNGGFNTLLTEQWKVSGQLTYSRYDYITTIEQDNFYTGQAGLTYILNAHVSMTGAYNYTEDSSNLTADTFTNNIFSISASLRF